MWGLGDYLFLMGFERARQPEQIEQRRGDILRAAAALFAEFGVDKTSLTAIAKRAKLSKANIYRYFESREAVLLALLDDRTQGWAATAIEQLGTVSKRLGVARRLDRVADVLAASAASRPVMCHLASVLPSVLEHNVSVATVRAYKQASLEVIGNLAAAMHEVVPELSLAGHGELLHHAFAFIVGSWPLANPSDVTVEAMMAPELAPFRHCFEQDLRRVFILMARGMLAPS